jgi:hypothetical protein
VAIQDKSVPDSQNLQTTLLFKKFWKLGRIFYLTTVTQMKLKKLARIKTSGENLVAASSTGKAVD